MQAIKKNLKRDSYRNKHIRRNRKRFNSFENDVKNWVDYDYVIINENLDVCFKQIETIILNNKKKLIFSINSVIL